MKEGRRVIIPTERQAEAMKKAASQPLLDAGGLSGIGFSVKDLTRLEKYIKDLGLSSQRQKQILERGEATDEYMYLRLIEILKDIRDGKKIDDLNDKNSKFSLASTIERWRGGDVEMAAMWDKDNRFIGFNVGKKDEVTPNVLAGHLAGGTLVHNHPIQEEGQKLGNPFSDADMVLFRDTGLRLSVVTAREGTFYMERIGNKPLTKLTDKLIKTSWSKTIIRFQLSNLIYQKNRDKLTTDDYYRMVWRDIHRFNKEVADAAGYSYKFVPNKGFQSLTDFRVSGELP
jgi:hypothetical protein